MGNDPQNITQKTKDRETRTALKLVMDQVQHIIPLRSPQNRYKPVITYAIFDICSYFPLIDTNVDI